ncbi:hypothetical protein [Flavobacterium luteum]|uniref:Periplasmic heavy metal sensor n=1 Tax=Flavobacterium luteum TaxID=2026654 RepID=A0A7J5AJN4_9FLAO|nr:hypothetical protein [Flavobacterium luteum]KAB1157703.1 hypothetical protein F6464_01060 [Flavobacterium luteum]
MDKTKLLTIAILALLLLNLGTLGFLFFNGSKERQLFNLSGPQEKPEPKEIIIHKLNFDAVQVTEYEKRIDWHRSEIRRIEDEIRSTKNELCLQLNKDTISNTTKDSLINALANYQKQIESTHFKHFQDIKKICRKEQLADFTYLTEDLSKIFSHPRKPPR